MYKNLNDFIKVLEDNQEIIKIKEFVDPVLEITEITDRISKQDGGGKALLFENNGTEFPVITNLFGSNKRMCLALGVEDLDDIRIEIEKIFHNLTSLKESFLDKLKVLPKLSKLSSWMPKVIPGKGACQEFVFKQSDITKLPVLKCWPEDGGRFITLPMVITRDPISGIRNVGMYRMQIFNKDLTGMHWHLHKVGARHFNEYKKERKKIPVAVALGGDPVYTYSATAPLPDHFDEFLFAGFLRKKRVELVKCITQDIEVPADSDFVIEGYIDPEEDFIWEGPFGDHTGFYSLADWYPKFHITCITHKKNAVYPATIVGIPPQEDAWIAKATERIFLTPIKMTLLPEIKDIDIPVSGVAHNLTIVKIEKSFPGQARKVMNALWGAGQMMFNKILIVIDSDINIHNYWEVLQVIFENTNPNTDIFFSSGPLDILDHASPKMGLGGKVCIDATKKLDIELQNESDYFYKDFTEISIDIENIRKSISEIVEINNLSLNRNFPLVIISIKKKQQFKIMDFFKKLIKLEELKEILYFILIDKEFYSDDLADIAWITGNNTDPGRDIYINSEIKTTNIPKVLVDATRKTADNGFVRDWPNVIVSKTQTIKKIDTLWPKLGISEFIPSPSLKYQKMGFKGGAVIDK